MKTTSFLVKCLLKFSLLECTHSFVIDGTIIEYSTKLSIYEQTMIHLPTLHLNPLCAKRNISRLLSSSAEMFKKPLWQTVWTQAVCSGSMLFASILNSSVIFWAIICSRRLQQTTFSDAFFLGALRVKSGPVCYQRLIFELLTTNACI